MKEIARRKDLIREYKEKKPQPGIFAVRCSATGAVWIGSSRHLDKQKNAIWFQLRAGGHMNPALQKAWNDHGVDAFFYDILEPVEDENAQMINLLLKDRATHWRETLGGEKLVG